jgi:hypothetical protein
MRTVTGGHVDCHRGSSSTYLEPYTVTHSEAFDYLARKLDGKFVIGPLMRRLSRSQDPSSIVTKLGACSTSTYALSL